MRWFIIKILMICPNFKEPTAWMISAYNTAINLAKKHEVIVLTSQTKGSLKYEKIEGVKVIRSKGYYIPDPFNYTFTPWIFNDLKKIIKKHNPDKFLISKYMFFPCLSGLYLRLLNKRYILQTDTFPGLCWFTESKLLNFCMWIYTRTLGKLILRLADSVIVLYPSLINEGKRLGLKNMFCIPNGVDYTKLSNSIPASDLYNDLPLITYLGRLDDVKGYKYALRLANDLKDKARFLFICGDKYPDKVAQLSKEYPHIRFDGFRHDIGPVFKSTDIYILPSIAEGLPNSLMEAMSCGCGVVASNVGGVSYIVGDAGLLFTKHDYKTFKDNVLLLLSNKKLLNMYKLKAKKRIQMFFDWKQIIREVEKHVTKQ